ncbi:uncharacterized protein [Epargyreus clarus]|uniref:uncharacterized protein n=1 Tax=Epargyreus clarus TaxID=520877 RepID=UPI003C2B7D04
MKLLWCCVLAVLTVSQAAVDVERTVQQVQSILKANTYLPRLSREEILQLLNDIRAEDAKTSTSKESKEQFSTKPATTTTTVAPTYSYEENEINPITQLPDLNVNYVLNLKDAVVSASAQPQTVEATTKSNEPTVMVVLPYTPRDGSSLQELYTRPPRVEHIPISKVTPKPVKTLKSNEEILKTLEKNAELARKQKLDLPAELQAFLDAHGLKGNAGNDHFLLPLEGFKPLPPARVIDGTVQLPENILLTYDLISPNTEIKGLSNDQVPSQTNFLYEPLRPQIPFELDTSSSETDESVLPYDLPKPRKTKSVNAPKTNYEPIDYDSVKVIPLRKGPNPVEDEKATLEIDQSKRQANATDDTVKETTTTADVTEADIPITNAPPESDSKAEADSGASITDLEDSFGGPAPEMPGDSVLPPPKKNGFYWMLDWNSFLEVGDGDTKVNIRFEPKLGDPQMFLPVNVP